MEKILFVDDELTFRLASKKLLESVGYSVDTASDGMDAEKFLDQAEYDFIITDIVMPRKEGIELILDIRQRKVKSKIIAISGGGRGSAQEYLAMAKAFQADAVLSKPYAFTELLSTMKKLSSEKDQSKLSI